VKTEVRGGKPEIDARYIHTFKIQTISTISKNNKEKSQTTLLIIICRGVERKFNTPAPPPQNKREYLDIIYLFRYLNMICLYKMGGKNN
jgi:hypothetical protein